MTNPLNSRNSSSAEKPGRKGIGEVIIKANNRLNSFSRGDNACTVQRGKTRESRRGGGEETKNHCQR